MRRPGKDAVEDGRPHPRLGAGGPAAAHERDPHAALLDVPAEQRQHRREGGQGAEHRDGDDHDGADGERCRTLVAGQELPGHRDHDGEAGGQDGPAGRGRRDLDGLERVMAGAALLALTLEIEERVVDADGHADQRDHDRGVVADGEDVARERHQADGRDHGRDGEQDGHAGGDERTERDHEDQQGDGQRERLGPLEVALDELVDLAADARIAELLDAQIGMCPLGGVDGGFHRRDAIGGGGGVALDVELHERGVLVLRDEIRAVRVGGGADIRHHGDRGDAGADVTDRRFERGIGHLRRRAVDQRRLVRRGGEALLERLLRFAGLAVELVGVRQLAGAEGRSEHDRGDDEDQPAGEHRLLVPRAPTSNCGGDAFLTSCTQHCGAPCRSFGRDGMPRC